MMTTPSLVFENYRTGELVAIEGADLPEGPITWGLMVRRDVTRYVGNDNVSSQVLGIQYEPITLSGVFDDQWDNNGRGHALRMRLALEGLATKGDLIRLGYNNDQVWGYLDPTFNEETPERIAYTLKFEPLYRRPPKPPTLTMAAAPADTGARLADAAALLDVSVAAPPVEVRTSFARDLFVSWAAAQNGIARMVADLSAAVYYAELTAEMANQVMRTGAGVLRGLADMSARLRAATADVVSEVTTPELLTAELWRDDLLVEVRALAALTVGLVRDVAAVALPTSARTHTVKAGETMTGLALTYYGDFGLWPLIADANGLDDDALTVGAILTIPNRPATR